MKMPTHLHLSSKWTHTHTHTNGCRGRRFYSLMYSLKRVNLTLTVSLYLYLCKSVCVCVSVGGSWVGALVGLYVFDRVNRGGSVSVREREGVRESKCSFHMSISQASKSG